jgi:hypothetical protein
VCTAWCSLMGGVIAGHARTGPSLSERRGAWLACGSASPHAAQRPTTLPTRQSDDVGSRYRSQQAAKRGRHRGGNNRLIPGSTTRLTAGPQDHHVIGPRLTPPRRQKTDPRRHAPVLSVSRLGTSGAVPLGPAGRACATRRRKDEQHISPDRAFVLGPVRSPRRTLLIQPRIHAAHTADVGPRSGDLRKVLGMHRKIDALCGVIW